MEDSRHLCQSLEADNGLFLQWNEPVFEEGQAGHPNLKPSSSSFCPPYSIFLFILLPHSNSLAFPLEWCPSNLCSTYPVYMCMHIYERLCVYRKISACGNGGVFMYVHIHTYAHISEITRLYKWIILIQTKNLY